MTSTVMLALLLLSSCGLVVSKKAHIDRSYQLTQVAPQGIHHFYSNGAPSLVYQNVPATVYVPGQVGIVTFPAGPPQVPVPSPSYEPAPHPTKPTYLPKEPVEPSVDITGASLPPVGSTYGPPKSLEIPYRKPYGGSYRSYMRYKGPPRSPSSRPSGRPLVFTHPHKGHLHTHYYPPTPPSGPSYPSKPSSYLPPNHIYPTSTPVPVSTPESDKPYNFHAHPPTAPSSDHSGLSSFLDHSASPQSSSNGGGEITQALIGPGGYIKNYDASIPIKIPNQKPHSHKVKEILKNADLHFVDVAENQPTTPSSIIHHSYPLPSSGPPTYPPQNHYNPSQNSYSPPQNSFSPPQTTYTVTSTHGGFQISSGPPQGPSYQGHHTSTYQTHPAPYQPQQSYQVHQINTASLPGYLQPQSPPKAYAELYDHRFQGPISYQTNRIEQDSSDTVKVPVAIFKGVLPPGVYPVPVPVERSDEDAADTARADFSASRRDHHNFNPSSSISSDWTPITGSSSNQQPETVRNLNQFGDAYFSQTSVKEKKEAKTGYRTSNFHIDPLAQNLPVPQKLTSERADESQRVEKMQPVGDIISGRIPGDHNPFENLSRDKRKGTVIDGASSTTISKVSDGSNLVVSSSIKFSR